MRMHKLMTLTFVLMICPTLSAQDATTPDLVATQTYDGKTYTVFYGIYALCSAAKCEPTGYFEAGRTKIQVMECSCEVPSNKTYWVTDNSDYVSLNTLVGDNNAQTLEKRFVSDYIWTTSFWTWNPATPKQNAYHGPFANCDGYPCIVDPKFPGTATCYCPMVMQSLDNSYSTFAKLTYNPILSGATQSDMPKAFNQYLQSIGIKSFTELTFTQATPNKSR